MSENQLIVELIGMINRQTSPHWSRLRLAVTVEELEQIKDFVRAGAVDTERVEFVHALKGVPLQVEEYPAHPMYQIEVISSRRSGAAT